jgi:PBP1b-binding outer membrane lipoprotein LpoB
MKLSFSSFKGTKQLTRNKNLFLLIFFAVFLNGCTGYQAPAPIYGSNPYENQSIDTTSRQKKYKATSKNKRIPSNTATSGLGTNTPSMVKPMSPAVLALVTEANRNSKAGDLESAVATIERALRIDARNPRLTYKLAALRLKQSKPRLAEDLAKKAALLSAGDKVLKKQSGLLISEARRQQNNHYGAKEARLKADNI